MRRVIFIITWNSFYSSCCAFHCSRDTSGSFSLLFSGLDSGLEESKRRLNTKKVVRKEKSIKRHPSGYWADKSNVLSELNGFWSDVNVPSQNRSLALPPIPSEALLNHFERHDIRWAIVFHGGREALSVRLGGLPIIPGQWKEAVKTDEVKQLLDPNNIASIGLSVDYSPASRQREKTQQPSRKKQKNLHSVNQQLNVATMNNSDKSRGYHSNRWSHRKGRKQWGYWTEEKLLNEIKKFALDNKDSLDRPLIFMPRMAEFVHLGRDDLRGAINRFGGPDKVAKFLNMIKPYEWEYFESLFALLNTLKAYLEKHYTLELSDISEFPSLSDIKQNDAALFALVQKHGGRKMVANRLGFQSFSTKRNGTHRLEHSLQWGNFSLDFAIDLMTFIREQLSSTEAVSMTGTIDMPSKDILEKSSEGKMLLEKIELYGGFEQVARRLGLNIFHQ